MSDRLSGKAVHLPHAEYPRHASQVWAVPDLLQRFIESFVKAVTVEMAAMRQRMGSFEVPLAQGALLDPEGDQRRYGYRVMQPNDKLVVHGECTLVTGSTEALVTILSLEGDQIVLGCDRDVDLGQASPVLVIYPWFLYEKLRIALRNLADDDSYYTDSALSLFGQGNPRHFNIPDPASDSASELNASQRRAVHLSCTCTPAFVWGPPGTGKTTTLGHIVTALLGLGQRILITSTTNAAVDQALDRLMELGKAQESLERGEIVRIGQGGERRGISLSQVVERLNEQIRDELTRLDERRRQLQIRIEACAQLLDTLAEVVEPQQLGFFEDKLPSAVRGGPRNSDSYVRWTQPSQGRMESWEPDVIFQLNSRPRSLWRPWSATRRWRSWRPSTTCIRT